jgi:Glycosyltransferase family 87
MVLVRMLLLVMFVAAVVGILVPAGLGWDFANFYDTGRRAAAGQLRDIYDTNSLIAGRAPQGTMAFWATPVSAWLYAPLAWFPPRTALIVFKLAGTVSFAAGLVLLYRLVRRCADSEWLAPLFCLAVLVYQPFWTIYRVGGQTTPFVFLLLTGGLLLYLRERYVACACCLLLAVLIKPTFLVVAGVLALVSGRRFLLSLGSVFVSAGLLSLALFGWPIHRQFLDILLRGAGHSSPWMFNSSLFIVADAFRPIVNSVPVTSEGGSVPILLGLALRAAVVASGAALFWRSFRDPLSPDQRRLVRFLLSLTFCLLVSNVVWEHYLSILFIPIAFLLAAAPRLDRKAQWHLGAVLALAIFQNLILVLYVRDHVHLNSTPALLAVSLIKAGPLLLALGFVWFRRDLVFRLAAAA